MGVESDDLDARRRDVSAPDPNSVRACRCVTHTTSMSQIGSLRHLPCMGTVLVKVSTESEPSGSRACSLPASAGWGQFLVQMVRDRALAPLPWRNSHATHQPRSAETVCDRTATCAGHLPDVIGRIIATRSATWDYGGELRETPCASVALFVGVLGCGCSSHSGSASSAVGDSPPRVEPTDIHVAATTTLQHNGALTVIKQEASVGGVVLAGAKSLEGSWCPAIAWSWAPSHGLLTGGASPWAHSVAQASTYNGLHVIDLDTGRDRQLTKDAYKQPAWSPDGAWLAYDASAFGTISLVRADGSRHLTLNTGRRNVRHPRLGHPTVHALLFKAATRSTPSHSTAHTRDSSPETPHRPPGPH